MSKYWKWPCVTQFAYGYTETARLSVLEIILTNMNRTNQEADQENEAAFLACRIYMQQASIVGRVPYVTLYIVDKANKRLGTRQRLAQN